MAAVSVARQVKPPAILPGLTLKQGSGPLGFGLSGKKVEI
jgi:hypothetical protein